MSGDQIEKLEERDEDDSQLDLLDSNHPLMKEFREVARGTHKHSQTLEGMGENVCAAIGMRSDAMKLSLRYHDIGKMWFPHLYSENQGKDNIHDDLSPWVSYQLITRHVSDTVAIMMANNFPAEVIKIAGQHHGTCVLKAIAEKAKSVDKKINIDDFRYKTPKPDCIESLILMLCDQVEAASRSIYVDQKKDIAPDDIVLNTYNKLHADGQFDNVEIVLGKLKSIQDALISDVASNFQKRVKYEENDELEEESNSNE